MSESSRHHEREGMVDHWDVELCQTCYKVPGKFCCAFWCPCCFSYLQRVRIYDDDLDNRYMCCGGAYGYCCPNQWRACPRFWLVLEVIFCFWCSVVGNRYLLQMAYYIKNTACEECILWTACIFSWLRLIFMLIFDYPWELDCLVDCLYCALQACMQSQQEHELDVRLGKRPGFKRDFTGHGGGHGGRDHGEGRHHREQRGHHADDGLYPPFDGGFSAEHDGNRGFVQYGQTAVDPQAQQLSAMTGRTLPECMYALQVNQYNMDMAAAWLMDNPPGGTTMTPPSHQPAPYVEHKAPYQG